MNIAFLKPPPGKSAGGLIAAINNLAESLPPTGVRVVDAVDEGAQAAHFHGLWQTHFQHAAKLCVKRGIPYVVSPHGMLEPWAFRNRWWKKLPYFHLIEKGFLSRARALLATSPGEAANLARLFPKQRIETIPLGLTGDARPDYSAARERLGWRDDEKVLLFLSRIDPKKGLDLLLLALAGAETAHCRVVIVGNGGPGYVSRLKGLAADLAPSLPPVEWTGDIWGAERWKYFQGADLFCLPSHSENFGLAALEAMQTGTPVLTTNATPWPNFLEHREGYFCEPTVESVRGALADFFRDGAWDAGRREALSEWAWKKFDWRHLAESYANLYRNISGPAAE